MTRPPTEAASSRHNDLVGVLDDLDREAVLMGFGMELLEN
jgi:hypothetical protein